MTIQWGDPIECNGVRPDWLRDGEEIQFENTTDDWLNGPAGRYIWDASDECPLTIRLPADHPAYIALARGFIPWSGGESAPDDWDGGTVLVLDGCGTPAQWKDPREINTAKLENWSGEGNAVQIIGYRKRVEYGAVHTDGSRSGGQPAPPVTDGKFIPRMTNDEATEFANKAALDGLGHTAPCYAASGAHACLKALGLIRPETLAERFTRETGHAVTEAVEAALNWKGE